ncbi:N-acetylgalactosamine-6-sulfatase, partial [Sphingobacterium shayense]|nr:N-acetylgalactosamine-6-sulfatase [Sphingobacterium shayense]
FFSYPKGKNRSPSLAMREGKWKFLMNQDGKRIELYNLDVDRQETQNVANANSELVKRYKSVLESWYNKLPAFISIE